ncbi:MAG: hypothetical protein QJR12_09515 [Mycobacterium sp.]|uniref:hypothetical protein n=1 Tax=Mycobacterium sp. TaxID=1785 RepID=UPI00260C722E|nr:hypothetical protein [Mycobacterium sp.]MDI3314498.1 hypothetical protein [Mycobacterium sp.]
MDERLVNALLAQQVLRSLSDERGNRDPWAELLTQCWQARRDDGDGPDYLHMPF